ncbi:MAG TPA: ester cyclase [Thermoanaerobaculia bacterium]|nr:ester cyclase [Thermoanaerobaculia bacterium]
MRYLTEVLGAGKLDQLDEIVAKGFVDHTPGASVRHGPEAARQAQQKLRDLFAKVEYQPQALIAEGDQVAAHYLVLATPKPAPGAPAAAPPLLLNGVALFRVRGGRIQEVFVLNDQIGLLRQLGYTLVPPGAGPPATAPSASPAVPPSSPPPPGRNLAAPPVPGPRPSSQPPSGPPASGRSASAAPPPAGSPSSGVRASGRFASSPPPSDSRPAGSRPSDSPPAGPAPSGSPATGLPGNAP